MAIKRDPEADARAAKAWDEFFEEFGDRIKRVEPTPGKVHVFLGRVPDDDPENGWVNPDENPDFFPSTK